MKTSTQKTYIIKRLIQPFVYLALLLWSVNVNAQVSLVQNAIDKLESYKNFSYRAVYKEKEYTADTLTIQRKDVFLKTPEDKNFGYLFSLENEVNDSKLPYIDFYNGKNVLRISPGDSTYWNRAINAGAIGNSLPERLKTIKSFLGKKPSQIAADTIMDGITCSHLIVNTYDTIINKEHYYTRINSFIDKASGLPNAIISRSRAMRNGNGVTNYYSSFRFFDYKFDQPGIDIAAMDIPQGFHPPIPPPVLLKPGEAAPDWTLYAANGKKLTLTQLKDKVVLLDFFFIGCEGCMLSLNPLNKLHEKYRNQNVEIVSITPRDSKKTITAFAKKYQIKYPMYVNGADAVKSYHVANFPTFYIVDKEGKIADVHEGYGDDFETRTTSTINNLLNK